MPRALIGLGANLGDCVAQLRAGADALARDGLTEIARSSWRETRPIGGPAGQPSYWNGAALSETELSPHDLWQRMARIESEAGRRRAERWGPRTLDLDLLLYDEWIIDDATLTIPHPRLALRRFVLEPAAEISASMRHPVLGRTIGELAAHVRTAPPVAAIAGVESLLGERLKRSIEIRLRSLTGSAAVERWHIVCSTTHAAQLTADDPALATPPRLLIVAGDADATRQAFDWPAEVRERVGPIVFVPAHEPDSAAEQAALAMLGLSDPTAR